LIKVLSDRNGNEFSADNRGIGSELIIDYPPLGRITRVYVVCFGISKEKEWRLVAEKEWIFDGVCSYTGKWVNVKK